MTYHQDRAPQTWLVELQLAHSGTRIVNCTLGAHENRPPRSESSEPVDPPAGGKKRVWLYDCDEVRRRCASSIERKATMRF
jgi:hypothetical protein